MKTTTKSTYAARPTTTTIKASEMLVAPRISECFDLPWSALVCYSLLTSSFAPFGRSGRVTHATMCQIVRNPNKFTQTWQIKKKLAQIQEILLTIFCWIFWEGDRKESKSKFQQIASNLKINNVPITLTNDRIVAWVTRPERPKGAKDEVKPARRAAA